MVKSGHEPHHPPSSEYPDNAAAIPPLVRIHAVIKELVDSVLATAPDGFVELCITQVSLGIKSTTTVVGLYGSTWVHVPISVPTHDLLVTLRSRTVIPKTPPWFRAMINAHPAAGSTPDLPDVVFEAAFDIGNQPPRHHTYTRQDYEDDLDLFPRELSQMPDWFLTGLLAPGQNYDYEPLHNLIRAAVINAQAGDIDTARCALEALVEQSPKAGPLALAVATRVFTHYRAGTLDYSEPHTSGSDPYSPISLPRQSCSDDLNDTDHFEHPDHPDSDSPDSDSPERALEYTTFDDLPLNNNPDQGNTAPDYPYSNGFTAPSHPPPDPSDPVTYGTALLFDSQSKHTLRPLAAALLPSLMEELRAELLQDRAGTELLTTVATITTLMTIIDMLRNATAAFAEQVCTEAFVDFEGARNREFFEQTMSRIQTANASKFHAWAVTSLLASTERTDRTLAARYATPLQLGTAIGNEPDLHTMATMFEVIAVRIDQGYDLRPASPGINAALYRLIITQRIETEYTGIVKVLRAGLVRPELVAKLSYPPAHDGIRAEALKAPYSDPGAALLAATSPNPTLRAAACSSGHLPLMMLQRLQLTDPDPVVATHATLALTQRKQGARPLSTNEP